MSNTNKKLLIGFFKKTFFAQIILLIVAIGIFSLFKPSIDLSNSSASDMATLVINFETKKRFFEGEVIKDMTILDALNAAVSVGKIKLNYVIDRSGNVNVMEIDGYTDGIGYKHFAFYVNFEKIDMEDLNKKFILNGDKIEIRNESR